MGTETHRLTNSELQLKSSSHLSIVLLIQHYAFRQTLHIDYIQLINVNIWHLRSHQGFTYQLNESTVNAAAVPEAGGVNLKSFQKQTENQNNKTAWRGFFSLLNCHSNIYSVKKARGQWLSSCLLENFAVWVVWNPACRTSQINRWIFKHGEAYLSLPLHWCVLIPIISVALNADF